MKASHERPGETIRVGVMGAGYMGSEYAHIILKTPGFELVSIFSRSKDRAMALYRQHDVERSVKSIDELSSLFRCQVAHFCACY